MSEWGKFQSRLEKGEKVEEILSLDTKSIKNNSDKVTSFNEDVTIGGTTYKLLPMYPSIEELSIKKNDGEAINLIIPDPAIPIAEVLPIYFLPIQTRVADNDHYNHINNSEYHFFADTIINCYLVWYCGLDTNNEGPRKIGYMVDTHCTYKRPLQYPQVLLAGLRVTSIGKSSVQYRVAFFQPKLDYMNMMKQNKSKDPHLELGLGSQGLVVKDNNLNLLNEMEKYYDSDASVLSSSVHVFVDSTTNHPVSKLPDQMSKGLNLIYEPNHNSNL